MKTIKQIADEIGVSKTAVRKKMQVLFKDDAGNQFAETVSGVVYISVSGETLIKSAFLKDTGNQLPETVSGQVSGWFAVVDTLKNELNTLQNELDIKNEQIKELNARLAESNAALLVAQQATKDAQALHAGTIQQQLQNGVADPTEPETTPSKKQGFFARVFGKDGK